MIAKKVPMRSIRKSDFGALVEYLTDRQGKHERIGNVWATNCQSEGWQVAITEVLNTQAQNTRSKADKTYHVIVSFRADEQPDGATLKSIEGRICEGLGYDNHQRICVVHHDTDNLHFHIAINKIHPTRYTIRDPYNDHWTLGILCTRLEQEYHLQGDNHQVGKTGSQDRAADMERQAGVQSLLGWIQRECAEQLKSARSWGELHTMLGCNGLELREKGNGLVITNGAGIGVKASSVAKELSKTSLVRRLGNFQPADVTKIRHGRQYEARPVRFRVDTTKLFRRYTSDMEAAATACKTEGAAATERRNLHIESARKIAQHKRDAVKIINCSRMSKKVLYGAINRTLRNARFKRLKGDASQNGWPSRANISALHGPTG
ncbi:TraI/MobA(P) family conjugative relaxase [Geomonas anaerohicana]|uniref:TraI/MobA(P) family conjugative relaxase n=1 Tax=Geomonas anaerohicana TaxID=2798583 RepID=UPI002E2E2403|nr:TraI/MobA(P) family conjugative relaxase [Geomonas anaerohicana]